MSDDSVLINRAPVLTLWASVVAERQGFSREEALSLAKVMAGLTAQTKGRMLGIFSAPKGPEGQPPEKTGLGEEMWVELCGRPVPAIRTPPGVRGVVKDKPVEPGAVERYLRSKFGADLERVRAAMAGLAAAFEPDELPRMAYPLYERFRPRVVSGERGWGQKGKLDLGLIRSLAPRS